MFKLITYKLSDYFCACWVPVAAQPFSSRIGRGSSLVASSRLLIA